MSKHVRRLTLSVLALMSFALLLTPAAQASPAPFLSYSQNGVAGSRAEACDAATQAILDHCDMHGTITTDPTGCHPLFGLNGEQIGRVCTCTATTTFCANQIPFPAPFPF